MAKNYIVTVSGRTIDFANPDPFQIALSDIAHGLSKEQRFGNQLAEEWSVAQHSLLVCYLVNDPKLKIYALLHDAHEAYTGDISTPLKRMLGNHDDRSGVYAVQDALDRAIGKSFGLPDFCEITSGKEIKAADAMALQLEARRFIVSGEHFETNLIQRGNDLANTAARYMERLPIYSPEETAKNFCDSFLLYRSA